MTKRFHLAEDIQSAHFCSKPPSFAGRQSAKRGAKADGLRYERKVQEVFYASDWYLPGPWILYVVAGAPYWCQPDGLHFDLSRGHITVVEIKLKHTPDSQRQLRGVYEPVLRRIFARPAWGVSLVEVCKWYDPDIRYPERHEMISDPFNHFSTHIGVHILRP
jgi:hypothetical protein